MSNESSAMLLRRQLKDLSKNPSEGFSAGLISDSNIWEWEVMIIGPPETPYEGGFFRATMSFPKEYPLVPPKMRFTSQMWHPNVYPSGEVCISILHAPGADEWGYEDASERWSPVHSVESILISVISMLSSPNADSPANLEAAKELRENPEAFRRRVARLVRLSQEA